MNKKVDIFLTIISLTLVSLALIVEMANLMQFGTQEVYLQHPEGLESENLKRAIEYGKLKMIFWTILTLILLTITIYSKTKRNRQLFNRTTLITFIVACYLPLLTIANGMVAKGLIMLAVLIGLVTLAIFQIRREKHKL